MTEESRFQKFELNHPVYKPESCKAKALVGFVLGLLTMPPAATKPGEKPKPWHAYVIRTTEDTLAVSMGSEDAKPVLAGTEVLLPVNQSLRKLAAFATDESRMFEVSIKPTKKMNRPGGKSMWMFDAAINPQPYRRDALALAMARASNAPQLPAVASGRNDDEDNGGVSGEEIPF